MFDLHHVLCKMPIQCQPCNQSNNYSWVLFGISMVHSSNPSLDFGGRTLGISPTLLDHVPHASIFSFLLHSGLIHNSRCTVYNLQNLFTFIFSRHWIITPSSSVRTAAWLTSVSVSQQRSCRTDPPVWRPRLPWCVPLTASRAA